MKFRCARWIFPTSSDEEYQITIGELWFVGSDPIDGLNERTYLACDVFDTPYEAKKYGLYNVLRTNPVWMVAYKYIITLFTRFQSRFEVLSTNWHQRRIENKHFWRVPLLMSTKYLI